MTLSSQRSGARWTRGPQSPRLIDEYPELSIIWRYWFDLGRYSGYIDKAGNHCWHNNNGNWVNEESNPSSVSVRNFGTLDAAKYVLGSLSQRTIRQIALEAVSARQYDASWAYIIVPTAATMLTKEVANECREHYIQMSRQIDRRDAPVYLEDYRFNTLNEAARYVLGPLNSRLIEAIAKEAFHFCHAAGAESDKDAASVAWANVILEAATDVLGMCKGGMTRCLQQQGEVSTISVGNIDQAAPVA